MSGIKSHIANKLGVVQGMFKKTDRLGGEGRSSSAMLLQLDCLYDAIIAGQTFVDIGVRL